MKETRIFKDGDTLFKVELDPVELTKFREKIINEMSEVDHYTTESPEVSYYSPKQSSIKERKDIEIRNYSEWHKPWIDVWNLYCSSYDRYVIPYIAKLIDEVLKGKFKAIDDIKKMKYENEYTPIYQTVIEYISMIAKYKEYHVEFPYSPLCHKAEAKVAEENINKYINILLDDDYAEKFRSYYEKVSEMISVSQLEEEQVIEQEQAGAKRRLTK